jgi:iron complex outermembrane recepter protein
MNLSVFVSIRSTCGWFARAGGILAAVTLSLAAPAAIAQEAGVVTGTVINAATQKVLERAVVSVDGTNLSTFTLPDGRFRLNGVPAGEQRLVISYAGLEDATLPVTVKAGESVGLEVALKAEDAVLQLDTYTVSAEPEGHAYAVQQQKNAETQRNVVSADVFGVISDANPGEFLKLMPGLQMDYTGVEPRTVAIRGLEANLNLVMINGNQAAAASSSSTNRAFEFDQTTIDNIESIEVFKAPVPWMPANAIGGTVNMITRSAFLQKGRRINATVNMTGNSDNLSISRSSGPNDVAERKIHPGGSFTYSDSFMDGRLGVVFSLSRVTVNGYGGTAYNTYASNTNGTYVSQYRREDHQNFTIRSGGSLNLDYKVSDNTTAYLRSTFNDHYYEFRNRFLILNSGTPTAGATPERVVVTNGNSQQNMSFGDKNSASWSVNPGVKHRWGDWTVEYDAALSRATNHYDYLPRMFGGITVQNSGIGYILEKDPRRANAVTLTQTSGADIYDLANYVPNTNSISIGKRHSVDQITSGKINVRRDFAARFPFYLQGGFSYQLQERNRENPTKTWTYAGPDGVVGTADDNTAAGASMMQFAEREYTPNLWFGERAPNAWISPFQLAKFYEISPQAFVENIPNTYNQAFRNTQTVSEGIYGYYGMVNAKFDRLNLLAGVRFETTYVDGEGTRQNGTVNTGSFPSPTSLADVIARLSRTRASTSYSPDPFKYLHLTYEVAKNVQARASFTQAIARPNFGSIIPGLTIGTNTVSASNTALNPQYSDNLDFSVEWYPSGTSIVKAAWFSKDITDYLVNNSSLITAPIPELGIGQELVGFTLNTTDNLGSAKIEGFELEGRYQLKFLPKAFGSLEVFGNYTKLSKTEGTFNAAAATTVYTSLPNLAPEMWNWGFGYDTPGRRFYFTLKANYVTDILLNLTTNEFKDARTVYDAEIRYKLSPRYTLSLAGRKVTEAEEGQHFADGRATRTGTGGGTALTLTLSARY